MESWLTRDWFHRDLTIDPGTSQTVLASRRQGMLAREHTRVILNQATRSNGAPHVLAFGTDALVRSFAGRRVQTIDPVVRGKLAHPIGMDILLREMIRKTRFQSAFSFAFGLRLGLVAAPNLAPSDRSDFLALSVEVGRSQARLIPAPFAAMRGCELDVHGPRAHMLLDFGGGKSYAVVTSLGDIAALAHVEFGGADLDEAIRKHIERRSHIVISPTTAEAVKRAVGSVYPRVEPLQTEVMGVDNRTGFEKKVLVDDNELRDILIDACEPLLTLIQRCLSETPAELAADIDAGGVTLLGGSALLSGLPEFLTERLGLRFQRAEDPMNATVLGAQALLLEGMED
ncbi:MAG TPA: rod shape-determining protein [bacterium]